ncbi:MAG: amidase [Pseudomonadota bacterium]
MTRAVDDAARIASGETTARAVTEACLSRIAEREPAVQAFCFLDPDHALRQADARDADRAAGRTRGPLHGVPVALKDVFDTADMPTENGTVLDKGRRPTSDATVVARLRAAGAIILGKTVTTELAFQAPGPTRHPMAPDHTPGGSSSGSAAAVADGMVPLTLGTQTVGSTIRPASFCGVVGYKPSHGRVPLTGALTTAMPLDTVGVFGRCVADCALAVEVMQGHDGIDPRTGLFAHERLSEAATSGPPREPVFAIVGGPFFDEVSADVRQLFDGLGARLGGAGDVVMLPDAFHNAHPAHMDIMKAEFARNLRGYVARGEGALSPQMTAALREGREVRATDYLAALDWRKTLAAGLDPIFDRYDAILTPAAGGEAPKGLGSTGDSRFNGLWTFVGAPAVSLPFGVGHTGLPIGLQVVGRPGEDAKLMATAAALEARLSDG